MSRTTHPLIPAKPAKITLDTLPQLFAHHRSRWGDMTMTAGTAEPPPAPEQLERPEGVTEEEWNALGDPGKQAIHRERERAVKAERDLAAARARPRPPGTPPPPAAPPKDEPTSVTPPGDQPDIAALIKQAVDAAVAPFRDAEAQREADGLAEKIRSAVIDSAKERFYDTGDALTGIDLTKVTDGNGRPDGEKITKALDDLLKAKPHLGKPVDTRRRGEPGSGSGGTPTDGNIDDRVKESLARMQASVPGVKFANRSAT